MYDIAPLFKSVIVLLPLDALEAMQHRLKTKGTGSEAECKAIFHLSIEILKRKWGCRLRWERTGTKV